MAFSRSISVLCPKARSSKVGLGAAVGIRAVFLHVTKACNLRCRHCYFSASEPLSDEMTTREYRSLWPDLVSLRPEKAVITGGEPLLREDLLELLESLRQTDTGHQVRRCLNSNGQHVTLEVARKLVGLVDEVRVSLDALREQNDALRGQGSFVAALQALDTLYSVGFEPKVLITVTSMSLPDLEDLLYLLMRRNLTRIRLNRFRPIGRGAGHSEWRPNGGEIQAALRRAWSRCYPTRAPLPESDGPESQSHCGAGQFLNVMPNGDVFPCHVLVNPEFRCGNVREQSLLDICRRDSLLGRLAAVDFHELARSDNAFSNLTRPGVCLGDVYADTRSSTAWRERLSLRATS